jgi:hypothetical protein
VVLVIIMSYVVTMREVLLLRRQMLTSLAAPPFGVSHHPYSMLTGSACLPSLLVTQGDSGAGSFTPCGWQRLVHRYMYCALGIIIQKVYNSNDDIA